MISNLIFIAFFSLLVLTEANDEQSTWKILASNVSNSSIWSDYGLTHHEGNCNWKYLNQYHTLILFLNDNQEGDRFLKVILYFNRSMNFSSSFMNQSATVEYKLYDNYRFDSRNQENRGQAIVSYREQLLSIYVDNSPFIQIRILKNVPLKSESSQNWFIFFIVTQLVLKMILYLSINFDFNVNKSLSYIYMFFLTGWEIYIHGALIVLIKQQTQDLLIMGLFIVGLQGMILGYYLLYKVYQQVVTDCQKFIFFFAIQIIVIVLPCDYVIWMFMLTPIFQIAHNSFYRQRQFIPLNALGLYLFNVILLMYPFGCPVNAFHRKVNYIQCGIMIGLAILQCFILLIQKLVGPFLCFRQLLSKIFYNYMQKIEIGDGSKLSQQICAICLQQLGKQGYIDEVKQDKEGVKWGIIMKTPCNHRFHQNCLKQWMRERLTCPADNLSIPPCID